jgi:monoterpene epsilon-lactone hydrolase
LVDADGTAHIRRIVPLPDTVSPEAQAWLKGMRGEGTEKPLAERRAEAAAGQARAAERMRQVYPTQTRFDTLAGVPVKIVTPPSIPNANRNHIYLNLHGGGFINDAGSVTESIPIASLSQTSVIAVLYRMAPEHPFPAAVDDAVAVYRELLKHHQATDIVIYGTSAGATLVAETAIQLKKLQLPLPAALGIFSCRSDYSRFGESEQLYNSRGFPGRRSPPGSAAPDPYPGNTDLRDPVLSPIFADCHGLPPTLFVTGTRDHLLSNTVMLHLAYLKAGVSAQLVVFEALPHAFWNEFSLPESHEAHLLMVRFFAEHVGKRVR